MFARSYSCVCVEVKELEKENKIGLGKKLVIDSNVYSDLDQIVHEYAVHFSALRVHVANVCPSIHPGTFPS